MTRVGRSLWTILWIGVVAGTLDITENIVFNAFREITAWRIFQFIASGLLGMESFRMGWTSVGLGVVIHYAIRTWLDRDFLHRRNQIDRPDTSADLCRHRLRHRGLHGDEFYRTTAFRDSAATRRGPTRRSNQCGRSVDILYRVAGVSLGPTRNER
jgi:hypothetical protein